MLKKRKWMYMLCVIIIVLLTSVYFNRQVLASVGFDWFVQDRIEAGLKDSYKPVEGREPTPAPTDAPKPEKEDPYSILLLGVDQRTSETGRSDTMLYTVVRPQDGNILMISIPRDMYVELVGKDRSDKINAAYAYGGAGMAMDTVEKFLNSPVNHYATINFQGFRDVIDTLGGISLPITEDIVNKDPLHEHFVIKANQDSYDGNDALNFVRYREDAGGDLSRTERQHEFLHAMIDKATNLKQWSKIPTLIGILGDNFSTDIPPEKLVDLAQSMLQQSNRNLYSHTMLGNGHRLVEGGPWYYFADEDDLAEVETMIQSWLDADTPAASLILPSEYASEQKEVQGPPSPDASAATGTE
ncbi:LCP family protein [Paenibacillus sp. HB172176]|uniref:LCP family protein n=1 Tax=Paenibacillus sp. HB172176 TaxID=2493690 RepID=UPI00143A5134|nr:LCP family protein [Paenibacillus sp. HB172176]